MAGRKTIVPFLLIAVLLISICPVGSAVAGISGRNHNVIVHYDGTLWAWGNNHYGQLGDGTSANRNAPVQVATDRDWQSAAAGTYHTLAIKKDGTLWAWGHNSHGQLGNGTDGLGTEVNTPQLIGSGFQSVAAGHGHSAAIKQDGTLWTWGLNASGQLGDGSNNPCNIPLMVGSVSDKWQTIATGHNYTLAIKKDSTLFTWGSNWSGQLGDGTDGAGTEKNTPQPIGPGWQNVAAGASHSIAIKENGTLWTWGNNSYGQLGDGSNNSRNVPGQMGTGTDWQTVAAGYAHSIALKTIGSLWTWGWNMVGQLGDENYGEGSASNIPVRAGNASNWQSVEGGLYHSLAVKNNGAVSTWGGNNYGQLGNGGGDSNTPIQVLGSGWQSIATGGNHTLAVKTDGSLWAWGFNYYGQLGDGTNNDSTIPVPISSDTDWKTVAAGSNHSLAIKNSGTLWSWGNNLQGQLGDGTSNPRNIPEKVGSASDWHSVAAGTHHTLAIKTNGNLWAWGNNNNGQLGNGAILPAANKQIPILINADTNWQSIVAGSNYSLAVKGGRLWAWGRNYSGQLGNGESLPGADKSSPILINADTDWQSIAAGASHSLAIKGGTLWAWGHNYYGQLGSGVDGSGTDENAPVQISSDTDWDNVAACSYHSLAVKDGSLWAWGHNGDGQLGNGASGPDADENTPIRIGTGTNWQKVSTAYYHSIASKSEGTLWAWGRNSSGQLGDGTAWSTVPVQIMPGRTPFFIYMPAILGDRQR